MRRFIQFLTVPGWSDRGCRSARTLCLALLAMTSLALVAGGCFPVELDVQGGSVLIPRAEGFFLYDTASGKVQKVASAADGTHPAFARFSPNGKDLLLISKQGDGYDFKFTVQPRNAPAASAREVFAGKATTYVRYSPDGKMLGITRAAENQDPAMKEQLPELLVVPADGGKEKVLLSNVGPTLRWMADSRHILAFHLTKKDDTGHYFGDLLLIDPATGTSKPLVTAAVGQGAYFDLSPDNKRVLFNALRAAKPGVNLERGVETDMKLFEADVQTGQLRPIDKIIRYAIYSPDGSKVLLGTPPDVFGGEAFNLVVADAGLLKFEPVGDAQAYMPMAMGGEGAMFPGWVDDKTILYLSTNVVYGTTAKNVSLNFISADGTGKRCVQPQIDLEAMKGH